MTKLIIDCETGKITERELNKAEKDQQKKDEVILSEFEAKRLTDAEAKAALLARLGLTEDEAKLLLL